MKTIKRLIAVLLAVVVVLAAGAIVGQTPAILGVEEEPSAAIEFEDQEGTGENVTIAELSLSDGGFIVISDESGQTIAISSYLDAGEHTNVTIEATDQELLGQLTATVHQDTTGDETYAYENTDGEEDRPYLEDGYPVSDTATVMPADADDGFIDDSFVVDSIDAPATATTNDTIEVTGTVRNPTDSSMQQPVAFRLDGLVLEQQLLDLDGGESRTVNFEIDTSGERPGNKTIGIYSNTDAALTTIELTYDGPATLEVTSVTTQNVTVNATLPETGFVALEEPDAETDAWNGTSTQLDPGEHDEVGIELEPPLGVENDTNLTAVLYAGDPADPENATVFEEDGVPVTAPLADADDDFE